jgi:hypothetical protein
LLRAAAVDGDRAVDLREHAINRDWSAEGKIDLLRQGSDPMKSQRPRAFESDQKNEFQALTRNSPHHSWEFH